MADVGPPGSTSGLVTQLTRMRSMHSLCAFQQGGVDRDVTTPERMARPSHLCLVATSRQLLRLWSSRSERTRTSAIPPAVRAATVLKCGHERGRAPAPVRGDVSPPGDTHSHGA